MYPDGTTQEMVDQWNGADDEDEFESIEEAETEEAVAAEGPRRIGDGWPEAF